MTMRVDDHACLPVKSRSCSAEILKLVSVSGVPIAGRDYQVKADDNLRTAAEVLLAHKLREIPVTDASGQDTPSDEDGTDRGAT